MKNTLIIAAAAAMFISSCKDAETPQPENESELITTVRLDLVNQSDTTDVSTFYFRDNDGPGGLDPLQWDTVRLAAGTTYDLTIALLDESTLPNGDISAEVEEEGTDHQLFFNIDPASLLTVDYNDSDDNGDPVGLVNVATTSSTGAGTLTVILKHQPGIKDGNQNTGETDVEVEFVLEVL
ncbi:MAG: hypothetical protein H6546_06610 [Chitinophagales bacterium]|nr:hypothetical protein [Chitinophagales bacterium]MCB9031210.1 hypothetical protein [Chitinophagales bacterium]